MKKIILSVVTISSLFFTSCTKDDNDTKVEVVKEDTKGGVITADETWSNDKIHFLSGKVVVQSGVTLTIEPGTIIKGKSGTGTLASALIVARGGKVIAKGTKDNPIIMTSEKDDIEIGQKSGTNLTENDNGLWGGLIILGNAKGSFKGNISEVQIEGIPAGNTWGLYGGNDDDDDSGVYQYISIRHGGALIGGGNEINGLTLGSVGRKTVVENIEVVANLDDGIEFFGGTVNAKNLLVWSCGDDGLDIDQAYSGTIENGLVVLGSASDHALEIDGPEGTYEAQFTMNNITLIGNSETSKGEYADYRSGAMGTTNNVYAYNFKADSDIELDNDGVATNYNDGKLKFGTWEIVLPNSVTSVESLFVNKAKEVSVADFGKSAKAVTLGTQTVGADVSVFDWTFSKMNGAF